MSEFWLPTELFDDEDSATDPKIPQNRAENRGKDSVTPFGYNCSSSDESLTGYESDEEEEEEEEDHYLSGLNRKLANSNLSHDSWKTEAGMKCLCGCKPVSVSRIFPEDARKAAEWEFLLAAAREIKRKRQIEEANEYYQSMGLNPVSQPMESNSNLAFRPEVPLSHQQLKIAKFQQIKREHLMKQQQAMAVEALSRHVAQPPRAGNLNLSKSVWPTSQQSLQLPHKLPHQLPVASSGMRGIILRNTGSKREAAGTGVFLPHSAGCVPEPRKKSDAAGYMRSNVPTGVQQKQNIRPTSAMAYTDLGLPQDWTY